jgi:hypothetical protein
LAGLEHYPTHRAYELAFSRIQTQFLVDTSKRTSWAEQFIAPCSYFNAHLIHLIRDPRGWYASEQRRRPGNPSEMIQEWTRENLYIRNFLQLSNVPSTTVFYEDLAGSPNFAFEQLCADMGCSFERSALRYWEKPHHGFAANGASRSVLSAAPYASKLSSFITGDDLFYTSNDRKSFLDQRWKTSLNEADVLAIQEDFRVSAFLNLYGRVLTTDGLHSLTTEERLLHRRLEGKFIRASGNTPQLERIYLVRAGFRHWVTSMEFIERTRRGVVTDLEILPLNSLERIPLGVPVRN